MSGEEKTNEGTATIAANGRVDRNVMRHSFRQRDPGGPPLGLGRMSSRDQWRYAESLARFRARHGEPTPLLTGEIGSVDGFRIVTHNAGVTGAELTKRPR